MRQCGVPKLGLPDSGAQDAEPHYLPASIFVLTRKLSLEAWIQLEFSVSVKQTLLALCMFRTRVKERAERVKDLPLASFSHPIPHGCPQRKIPLTLKELTDNPPPTPSTLCLNSEADSLQYELAQHIGNLAGCLPNANLELDSRMNGPCQYLDFEGAGL